MAEVRITKSRWAAMAAEAQQVVDDVTEFYAAEIEQSAAIAAPYEYGVLQESIAVEGAHVGALMAQRRITVGAFYGLFQHEGTKRGIDPNPFLKDAVEFWRADYLRAVGLAVQGVW